MSSETVVFWIFLIVIIAGVAVIIAGMQHRTKVIEMAHRERLAMIERGHQLGAEAHLNPPVARTRATRSGRLLTAGIALVGLGLGLGVLLGFAAGETEIAFGLGGAIAVIGATFIVAAYVVQDPG
jgi:hypothetical protein